VHGDREALASAVVSLVDNAIKYSPPGSRFGWRLYSTEASFPSPTGDRASPEEQARIFVLLPAAVPHAE
jgi:signal transduction histidine kinase